jgi:phosphinothricin acetyltransferase
MSETEIRAASPADLPAISEIYQHAVRFGTATFELDPPDLAEMIRRFESLTSGGYPYLVAIQDGRAIGYAYAGPYRPRPAYRFTVENSIYLAPAVQHRGIGTALLRTLIAKSEARGYRQMIGVIGDSANAGSIGVHRKCGFELLGTHPNVGFKIRPLARHRDDAACARRRRHHPAGRNRRGSYLNQRQFAIDHQQHALEFMAAAQNEAGGRNNAVGPLLAGQPRIFFDAVDRHFGSAPEYRKHGAVFQEIDGVIPPLAIGDHAAIQIEYATKLETIERHPSQWGSGGSRALRHRPGLAWISLPRDQTHPASPCHVGFMIAPTARGCKRLGRGMPKLSAREPQLYGIASETSTLAGNKPSRER